MSQATILEDTLKSLGGVHASIERSHAESDQLGKSWSILSTITNAVSVGATGWLLSMSGVGRHVKSIYHELKEVSQMKDLIDIGNADERLATLSESLAYLSEKGLKDGNAQYDLAKKQVKMAELELQQIKWKNEARKEYVELGKIEVKWLVLAGTTIAGMLSTSRTLNESLIHANSSIAARYDLLTKIYKVQSETGASTREMSVVAHALTEYGIDLNSNFADSAKLVYQMNSGLGVSVQHGAELVSAFQRLGVDVRSVGDGIARVTADTALSADEASRFSINIARALSTMRTGMGKGSSEVAEFLNRIEGQLKSATGVTGELTAMYTRMTTTLDGAGVAHMLGIKNIESLGGKDGAERMTKALRSLVDNTLRGLGGDARLSALESLSEMTGMSTLALSSLSTAMDDASKKMGSRTTIEQAWKNQLVTTGEAVNSMIGSLRFLAIKVVQPLLLPIQMLSKAAASLIGTVSKIPGITVALQGLALMAIPYLIKQVYSLTTSLIFLARAAAMAAKSAAAAAASQATEGTLERGSGIFDAIKDIIGNKGGSPGRGTPGPGPAGFGYGGVVTRAGSAAAAATSMERLTSAFTKGYEFQKLLMVARFENLRSMVAMSKAYQWGASAVTAASGAIGRIPTLFGKAASSGVSSLAMRMLLPMMGGLGAVAGAAVPVIIGAVAAYGLYKIANAALGGKLDNWQQKFFSSFMAQKKDYTKQDAFTTDVKRMVRTKTEQGASASEIRDAIEKEKKIGKLKGLSDIDVAIAIGKGMRERESLLTAKLTKAQLNLGTGQSDQKTAEYLKKQLEVNEEIAESLRVMVSTARKEAQENEKRENARDNEAIIRSLGNHIGWAPVPVGH